MAANLPLHSNHDDEVSDRLGGLIRPRSTPPLHVESSSRLSREPSSGQLNPAKIRFSIDTSMIEGRRGADTMSRSLGESDHLYTSGLRRIRQQNPHAQGFLPGSPTASVSSTRVNSTSLATSPTLGSCEDLARFPSESLHSFSFAHQSEELIHSRQNILKRSIGFMRDKFGWGNRSTSLTTAQAKAEGCEDWEGMMELLRRADLVSREKTPMLTGPLTGPADVEGNPFEKTFSRARSPVFHDSFSSQRSPILQDKRLSSSPEHEVPSENTSRSATNDSLASSQSSPPSSRRPTMRRTYTDTDSLSVQIKLYEALAQPYFASDEPQYGATSNGPQRSLRKSSVHGHTSRFSPPSQAIFTTEADSPWTILAANDLACLVFGLTKDQVRKIGIMELVREERREWLAQKLNSGENTSTTFPYPHNVHYGATSSTDPKFHSNGRRVKSDAFYTGSPLSQNGMGYGKTYSPINPNHNQNRSRGVVLCGDVVPIQKRNGNTGAASLWVKEKKGGLIWVIEEITEDVCYLHTNQGEDKSERVQRFEGNSAKIFGIEEGPAASETVKDLLPQVPVREDSSMDFIHIASVHHFTSLHRAGIRIPCGVEPLTKERGFRVSSFPHIAGIIVLSASTLQIASSNAVFSASLFGRLSPVGAHITDLIPQFDRMLEYLQKEEHVNLVDGMVVPEHSFRKANAALALKDGNEDALSIFSRPSGLIALHRDGGEIHVDCQMRVVLSESSDVENAVVDDSDVGPSGSEVVYALWITYSRHLHLASVSTDSAKSLTLRPSTPPQKPSPGQTSTIAPMLMTPKGESKAVSLLSKQLGAVQSPTPPSSEDEATTLARPHVLAHKSKSPSMSKRAKAIQDFIILEDMGQGAYGQVKLARYKQNGGDRVVLKYVTKCRILVDTWTRDRRLGTVPLEIHVLDYLRRDGLQHPNIVEMSDFFEDDTNYYIEMIPHGLPGMDLFDYIELKVNMEENECRSIFVQIARALYHLHIKAGVVHRDIKDENVILDGEGNIKLIDFGSAAYIKNGPFDVFVGTIDYAAPEVLQGKSYKGKEQDVWALGVLLYTICYKENPFYNIDEIMDRELRIPFVMSEDCLDLIKLMLDRDVERRPSIEQVLAHHWFDGLPGPDEALLVEVPVQASTKIDT